MILPLTLSLMLLHLGPNLTSGPGTLSLVVDSRAGMLAVNDSLPRDLTLTENQIERFLVTKRALADYQSAHGRVRGPIIQTEISLGIKRVAVASRDYQNLIGDDSELAAAFAGNGIAVNEYFPVLTALSHALALLEIEDATKGTTPPQDAVVRANVALVKKYRAQLDASGTRANKPFYSCTSLSLSPALVADYIALKNDLKAYWNAPEHADVLRVAKATVRWPYFRAVDTWWDKVGRAYDYPDLVGRDTKLATLFANHHLAPEQFEPVQVVVHCNMMELIAREKFGVPMPVDSAQFRHNLSIVKAQRQALEDAGVVAYSSTMTKIAGTNTPGSVSNGGPEKLWVLAMEP